MIKIFKKWIPCFIEAMVLSIVTIIINLINHRNINESNFIVSKNIYILNIHFWKRNCPIWMKKLKKHIFVPKSVFWSSFFIFPNSIQYFFVQFPLISCFSGESGSSQSDSLVDRIFGGFAFFPNIEKIHEISHFIVSRLYLNWRFVSSPSLLSLPAEIVLRILTLLSKWIVFATVGLIPRTGVLIIIIKPPPLRSEAAKCFKRLLFFTKSHQMFWTVFY